MDIADIADIVDIVDIIYFNVGLSSFSAVWSQCDINFRWYIWTIELIYFALDIVDIIDIVDIVDQSQFDNTLSIMVLRDAGASKKMFFLWFPISPLVIIGNMSIIHKYVEGEKYNHRWR